MTPFVSQLVATLVGAVTAFFLAIVMFQLSERWKARKTRRELKSRLIREFEVNTRYMADFLRELTDVTQRVSAGDTQSYLVKAQFKKLLRVTVFRCLEKGLLYNWFNDDEIWKIDLMVTYFNMTTDQFLYQSFLAYKQGAMEQADFIKQLHFHRDKISEFKDITDSLAKKLKEH